MSVTSCSFHEGTHVLAIGRCQETRWKSFSPEVDVSPFFNDGNRHPLPSTFSFMTSARADVIGWSLLQGTAPGGISECPHTLHLSACWLDLGIMAQTL